MSAPESVHPLTRRLIENQAVRVALSGPLGDLVDAAARYSQAYVVRSEIEGVVRIAGDALDEIHEVYAQADQVARLAADALLDAALRANKIDPRTETGL